MRMPILKGLLPLAAIAVGLSAAGGAQAALVINLDTEFSGADTPENTYTATFESCGADCVRLTMAITGSSTTEFVDGASSGSFGWGFNYDPNRASDLGLLSFAFVSGNDADFIAVQENAFKADGDGNFDIVFSWSSENFVAGQTSVYDITGVDGLTEAFFNFQSLCQQGCGNDAWTSAAHVQGIGAGGEGSGWIGGNPEDGGGPPTGNPVPEPSALLLLGTGLLGLWGLRRR